MVPCQEQAFSCPQNGVDKGAVVAHYRQQAKEVAYAGDGPPDLSAVLQLPPKGRFARGWLAQALNERQEGFVPFSQWHQCAQMLVQREEEPCSAVPSPS